jgi:tetratricopeptide (TPR) repeat protein
VFATLLYSNGLKTQAMTYFNQAKNISPGDSRLTLWLIDRKMINEGLSLLNEQLIKDSENVTLLTNAVRVFSSVGDKSNATLYLNSLERILKSGEEIKKLKGEILENDGRMSEALSVYEDAIKIHPKDMFLVRHLANIYSQNQSWDKLIRHYRVSLEYLPNEPFLLEGLGKTLVSCPQANLRNIDEGMEYSERAFINYKSSVQIQLSAGKTLATAYAMAGDKFKASSYIKSTLVLAKKLNLYQEYNSYFWNLKKEYNFSN